MPGNLAELKRATASMLYLQFQGDQGHKYRPITEYIRSQCDCRAAIITVALQLYRHDHGRFPDSLDALVPKYLDSIPVDPLSRSKAPFQYRLSGDEWLEWDEKPQESRQFFPTLPGLDPELAICVSAVAGGCVHWVNPPLPPPGADLPHSSVQTLIMGGPGGGAPGGMMPAGAMGGPGGPAGAMGGPGGPALLPEEEQINRVANLESIASFASGLIFWPTRNSLADDRQMLHVPRGWGILWSVDFDGVDHGGTSSLMLHNGVNLIPGLVGDRIYVVPPPGSRANPTNED